MIKVKYICVKSAQTKEQEQYSRIFLQNEGHKPFEFSDKEEIITFTDQLRQAFEYLFPFGCIVQVVTVEDLSDSQLNNTN